MRGKFPEFTAQGPWKEVVGFDPQNFGNHEELQIGNPPVLIFQSGDGFAAGVPPEQLEFDCQAILGPALLEAELSHLRPNHIQV